MIEIDFDDGGDGGEGVVMCRWWCSMIRSMAINPFETVVGQQKKNSNNIKHRRQQNRLWSSLFGI